jgi:DNA-binding transcriptional LysR family regulator
MELRHLRYFVAVAEELHFRRAAERLHIAQPAVSEQVRKLEQELGVRLFDRNQRRVELTAAGAALLTEARHVLRQAQVAQQAARTAAGHGALRLRLGYIADALPGAVPHALRTIATGAQRVETSLETGPALSLIEAVRDGRLDAAVVGLPAPTAGLHTLPLGQQNAIAALPAGDPQAVRPAIDLEQMAPERIVVLPRAGNPAFYDAVVSTCRQAGLTPTLVELAEAHVEQALLAVVAGAGMALLPESVADRYAAPGIRFLPLIGPAVVLETGVVTRARAGHLPTDTFLNALTRVRRLTAVPDPVRLVGAVA